MQSDDRRMFAPALRREVQSLEAHLCAVLETCGAGATAIGLAEALFRAGLAVGPRALVTRRVAELLDELERAARIERIPDGRYRVVKAKR